MTGIFIKENLVYVFIYMLYTVAYILCGFLEYVDILNTLHL